MDSLTRYEGALSSDVRIQLTDLIMAAAVANIGKRPSVKKLCSIAIEMLDNAQRYCATGNVNFLWSLDGNVVHIRIENLASETDAQRMLEAVEMVNRMSPDELSAAFRAQLSNGQFGEKGGAGLGFLDIARRSKSPIQAEIEPTGDGHYLCRSAVATIIDRT